MFPNVPKQKRWIREDPPFGLVRATFSSGDRIRTCDLWVMSQPVAVSPNPFRLKRAAHADSPGLSITRSLTPISVIAPCFVHKSVHNTISSQCSHLGGTGTPVICWRRPVPIRSFRSTSRQVSLCVLGRRQLRPLDPQSAMSRFHASQHGADIALTSLNRSGHLPQSQRVSRGL